MHATKIERAGTIQMSSIEAWARLRGQSVGRLVTSDNEGRDVFPVNFLADDDLIYIRSAHGRKLAVIARHPNVAFEVDDLDASDPWSVVVRGVAREVGQEEADGVGTRLWLWPGLPTDTMLALTPVAVTGVRFSR